MLSICHLPVCSLLSITSNDFGVHRAEARCQCTLGGPSCGGLDLQHRSESASLDRTGHQITGPCPLPCTCPSLGSISLILLTQQLFQQGALPCSRGVKWHSPSSLCSKSCRCFLETLQSLASPLLPVVFWMSSLSAERAQMLCRMGLWAGAPRTFLPSGEWD